MKHILVFLFLLAGVFTKAQTTFAEETLYKMEEMGVGFLAPLDQKYKVVVPKKKKRQDEYYGHDYEVHMDDRVVWVKLLNEDEQSLIQYPHLEFHRILTHLATNEGNSYIYMYDVPLEEGVDWMSEARFTPKSKVSKFKYATAKGYYRSGKGMILLLYFDKDMITRFTPVAGFIDENKDDQY